MEYQAPEPRQVTAPQSSVPSGPTEDVPQSTVGNQGVQQQLGGGSGDGGGDGGGDGLGHPPGSLAEVRQMSPEDVASSYADPKSARPLLMQVFNSDWFVAKAALVRDKWPDGPGTADNVAAMTDLMKKFLALREWETEETLVKVRDVDVMNLPGAHGMEPEERLKWGSAGSQSLTSDIDLNLKGAFNSQAVALFNAGFLARGWGFEAGIVYDVNVYAKDFMEGFGVSTSPSDPTLGLITPTAEVELDDTAQQEDAGDQEIWSLVKMRRYMTDTDWETYKGGMSQGAATEAQVAQWTEVEARYTRWKKELDDEIAKIQPDVDSAVSALKDGGKALSAHDKSDIAAMAASNRVYEEKLKTIIALRGELARLNGLPRNPTNRKKYRDTALELRTRLSEGALFANEAYVTDGAVNHVVVGVQIGGSDKFRKGQQEKGNLGSQVDRVQIDLPEEQFLHSFNEQVADALKELGHYSDVGEAFYQGGKYVQRMGLAVDRLPGVDGVANRAGFKALGEEALRLKGDQDLGFAEKFAAVRSACQSGLGTQDNASVRALLVQFCIDVTTAYKAQAGQESSGPGPGPSPSPQAAQQVEQGPDTRGDQVMVQLREKLALVRAKVNRIGQSASRLDTE